MKPSFRRRWWLIPALPILAAAAGFSWFLYLTERPAAVFDRADGIVVLTGGAERIEAGIRLLAGEKAATMLISGIGGRGELALLARGSGVDTASLADRVKLGREATSTHGNALETAAWARDNRIGTLIVVTAWYHMPRALVELHRMLPGVTLLPDPVRAQPTRARTVAGTFANLRLLSEEYAKYAIVVTGLTAYLPVRDAGKPS